MLMDEPATSNSADGENVQKTDSYHFYFAVLCMIVPPFELPALL